MEVPNQRALLTAATGLLTIAIVCATAACGHQPSTADASTPRSAAVALVKRQAISNQLSIAGEFLPYQDVQIHAKVAGYIKKINVDIGDRVHTGEVLATLEIPELVAQVDEANAAVHHAEEEIQRAHSEVSRAEADNVALHSNAERLVNTDKARPGLIAQQELDDATAKDRASQAQVDAAKSSLAAAKQQLEVAKANYQHYSALRDYAQITAPYDGVITARYADTGALVQAGTSGSQPVVTLAQTNILRLRVPAPESIVPAIHQGQTADVVVSATGEHFTGKVTRYTDSLDRSTRTMQVEIDVPNPKYTLSPGMYAQVTLHTDQLADALALPVVAIHKTGDISSVLLVDAQNRVQLREIGTGVEDPNFVQVTSGLKEGDRVIVGNPGAFQLGEVVSPKESSVSTKMAAPGEGGSE
ncbi:MAG TPA: efflux RND transporter periplasmic adaptor subunit [Candidatus Koribacter sp.]|jgi:RND family efflux transporter MFP subunit